METEQSETLLDNSTACKQRKGDAEKKPDSTSATITIYSDEELAAFKESLVAQNTKKSTSTTVRRLQSWYATKYGKALNVNTISKVEAPYLLKHFFVEIRQTTKPNQGKEYEPGSLQTYRNGLRRYFIERPCPPAPDNFDIDKMPGIEFEEIATVLAMKKKDLKKKGYGNKPNAADSLEDNEIELMWSSGAIGLHNPRALLNLVWWNNMRHLGMRGVKEHQDACIDDFKFKEDYIEYNERQTKNRQGDEGSRKQKRKYDNKLFRTDGGERDPYRAFSEFLKHRPKGENVVQNLYLTPIPNPKSSTWYKVSPIGANTLAKVMKNIVSVAKLPESKKFTNSSGRKTSIQTLRDDFNPLEISELTGHANPESISSYSHNPLEKQRKMSHKLSGYSSSTSTASSTAIESASNSSRSALAEIQPPAVQVNMENRPALTIPSLGPAGLLSGAVSGMFSGAAFNNSPVNISINLQANVDRRP